MNMPIYYYHVIAFLAGFLLDAILGDPYSFPHPVKWMGRLISFLENKYLGPKTETEKMTGEVQEAREESREAPLKAGAASEAKVPWEDTYVPVMGNPEEYDWSQTPVKKTEEKFQEKPEEKPAENPEASLEALREQSRDEQETSPKNDGRENLSEEAKKKRSQGRITVLIVLLCTVAITDVLFVGSYALHPVLGCMIETVMTYQILAAKCLCVESMKVYKALKTSGLREARKAVSMIVGRDTENLDEEGVIRAAVETVAENTSDGVIAPMLYLALGGPILGMAYKAINTMDSMIGYKNERYLDFGRAAAKLDDAVNYVPSRISAWLMIAACHFLGNPFIASEAKRIYLRDRRKHASPNSAQTESACAGALGVRLAGDASYFGKIVHKPFIGDARRKISAQDIPNADRLMYGTAILCLLICLGLMVGVCFAFLGGTTTIEFLNKTIMNS